MNIVILYPYGQGNSTSSQRKSGNFIYLKVCENPVSSLSLFLMYLFSLKSKFADKAMDEIKELQEFARTEGFTEKLEMWDLPYWRRIHREYLYQ